MATKLHKIDWIANARKPALAIATARNRERLAETAGYHTRAGARPEGRAYRSIRRPFGAV